MDVAWILGDESPHAEVVIVVGQVVFLAELVDVGHEFFLGESCERVFKGRGEVLYIGEGASPSALAMFHVSLISRLAAQFYIFLILHCRKRAWKRYVSVDWRTEGPSIGSLSVLRM